MVLFCSQSQFNRFLETACQFSSKIQNTKIAKKNKFVATFCKTVSIDSDQLISLIFDLHNVLFFLDSRYYEISNRLAKIKYVSVFPDEKKDFNYRFVGFVILATYLSKFATFLGLFLRTYKSLNFEGQKITEIPDNVLDGVTGNVINDCKICYDERIEPAATICGHLFCWKCIQKYAQIKNECPICRTKIHPKDIFRLFNC